MWYRKAKKYLVAITFSVMLVVLSGLAGSSVVAAEGSYYRLSDYNYPVGVGVWVGGHKPYRRHEPRVWRHHYRGYYDRYGYFHPWRY
jgi:hypothetical protein